MNINFTPSEKQIVTKILNNKHHYNVEHDFTVGEHMYVSPVLSALNKLNANATNFTPTEIKTICNCINEGAFDSPDKEIFEQKHEKQAKAYFNVLKKCGYFNNLA